MKKQADYGRFILPGIMDGRDGSVPQSITNDSDLRGLQVLFERISSSSFHYSDERLEETNPITVRKWVQKWIPRLESLLSSDLPSIPPTQAQPLNPEQIIIDVFTWLFDRSSSCPIMWIHHKDRSQTSFLAQTIADILDELDHFAGSFFSTSDGPKGTRKIIPTLAFQLAQKVPGTRSPIAQTVVQDLSVFESQAKTQIKRLIVNPLLSALNSGRMETGGIPKAFLIHGLEDFDDAKHFQLSFLYAFSDALALLSSHNIPHRLLLIGQDSSHIRRCILNANLRERVLERPITVETPLGEEEGDRSTKGGLGKRGEVPWSLMNTLQGHSGSVNAVAFSADGTRLASGSSDCTVRLWDGKTGSHVATLEGHSGDVRGVAFSRDGLKLASASDDKTVRLWDVKTGRLINALQGHSSLVLSVAISRDGSRLASGSRDKTVCLWDVRTASLVVTLDSHTDYVRGVAFSPDGSKLASASDDRAIRLWDGKTGSLLAVLAGHTHYVLAVAFSPDGSTLASGSIDTTVRLWDIKNGCHIATLGGHSALSVAFAPDGLILASGSNDSMVRLWDVGTGSLIAFLEGHSSSVLSVAFSPDGLRLASASGDKTIRMWH